MDDKTFDSLAKLSVTSTGRRRLLQAAGAAGLGSLLTRGVAGAADEVVAEACQNRGSRCQRNRQCACKTGREFQNVICDPLPNRCNENGTRCCGIRDATCDRDCDCCKGFRCNDNNRCERK